MALFGRHIQHKTARGAAAHGASGNAPRTLAGCSAPGYRNVDASIFKDFKVERVTFQFRGEFMNLTNTPQFNNPNTNIELPASGGRIFSAKDARIGQFALKLYF